MEFLAVIARPTSNSSPQPSPECIHPLFLSKILSGKLRCVSELI